MFRTHRPNEVILAGFPDTLGKLEQKASKEGQSLPRRYVFEIEIGGKLVRFGVHSTGNDQKPDKTDEVGQKLLGWARADKWGIAVERNCALGTPYSQQGSPWSWEGSPWSWEGSPWSWEGSELTPRLIAAGTTPAEGEQYFWKQGAFQRIGLTDANGQRLPSLACHTGAGVVVGVFDTKPSKTVSLPWLTVHPSPIPIESPFDDPQRDYSDHGLIAASLIHAVAPQAEVHLYEVLTPDAYGSLYPLLFALATFINTYKGRPAVINLSLGSMCCTGTSVALQSLLQEATNQGMVVCAAAGNRGKQASKSCNIPPAQMPAAFPNVFAVAASSLRNERATYTQRGDIAAPGGEDLGPVGPGDEDDIIGMGVSSPAGDPSGFVVMDAGTSFSSPLTAGASALVVADLVRQGTALSPNTYKQVFDKLKAGATPVSGGESLQTDGMGAGIINLGRSLSAC